MREIKFRAWDKENGEMIYSDNVGGDYYFVITDKSVLCVMDVSYDDSFGLPTTSLSEINEVMQYTGLKDKNGKEIFEGDILKYYSIDKNLYMIIRFGEYKESCGSNLGFNVEHIGKRYKYYRKDLLFWLEDSEIVGNIYENPELLEAQDV